MMKLEKNLIIYYIIILDLLFFPYFKLLKTSYSSILLLLLFLLNIKLMLNKRSLKFLFICFFPILSLFFSVLFYPEYFSNNLSRVIILELFVLLFFIFSYSEKYLSKININKILFYYLCFNTFLAIIFFININKYFLIRSFWSLNNYVDINQGLSILSRFTGIISDPNNCACTTIAIVSFMDTDLFTKFKKILVNLMMIFIVFLTMSVTGLVCLIIYYVYKLDIFSYRKKIKKSYIIYTILILLITIIFIKLFFNSEYGKLFIERININTDTSSSNNGRIDIWLMLLNNLNIFTFLIIGFSGNVIVNNILINPHSGHLYLVYNFGWVVYILFLLIFFKRNYVQKNKLLYLIFFINFTLNTVLIDYRCSMLYAVLLSFTAIKKK